MINPGGTPGTSFSKSATTRFNNNQVNAARSTMPFNQAAQDSLRNQYSKKNSSGRPPVGPQHDPSQVLMTAPPQENVAVPTGGPQMPEPEGFDPAVFREEMINKVVGTLRTEQFLESPRVKDAMTQIRVKNIFNASNPNAMPDNRPLLKQVIDRMGLSDAE